MPEGESADAIVRRVEKRLDGDWNLATKTLRQTIARQQRLGQDSAPAEAYLRTLTCLQKEVESGQHNAFLEANGGKARLGQPTEPLVSQTAPTQPFVPPVPDAGEQPAATSAPVDLTNLGAASQSATPTVTAAAVPPPPQAAPQSPQPLQQTAPPPVSAPPPQAAPPVLPQATTTRQVPQVSEGVILPGTPESYALLGSGQVSGRTTVPAVRPLDGTTTGQQSVSVPAAAYPQRPLAVPPEAPKYRGSSFQEIASRSAPPPQPAAQAPQPAAQPPQPVETAPGPQPVEQAAPTPVTPQAPQPVAVEGDPRYVNKACLYFTRPELEVIRGRVYTNRYLNGARVCHEGTMYLCDGGLWSVQGACSAFPDSQSLDSAVLEAKPRS